MRVLDHASIVMGMTNYDVREIDRLEATARVYGVGATSVSSDLLLVPPFQSAILQALENIGRMLYEWWLVN